MSDDQGFDPEDFEGLQERTRNIPVRQIKRWEQESKDLREVRDKLEQLQRERSFVKAGIPETGLGKLFMKGYDGPDDVDAIKASALEYGVLQAEGGQPQVDQSLAGHDATRSAVSGGAIPDPHVDLEARMRAAKNPQELAQIMHEAGVKPTDLQNFPELRR